MNLTARLNGHTVELVTDGDTPLRTIGLGNLDEAIRALCTLRFEQDPAGYREFIDKLFPKHTPLEVTFTFRDVADRLRATDGLDDDDIEGITGRKR